MALIICENLNIGYEGRNVRENLNFRVEQGQYVGIVGDNGAGKSTLMKTILGLQKPLSGELKFGDGLLQNEIGYIPQQSSAQRDFPATVSEVVLSGCLNRHGRIAFYNRQDRQSAVENLKKMGIFELKGKCYKELSGGQQQRVLMARALCAAKKILFLDEPMSGLDSETTEELYKVLEGLNREGMTIMMISHDMEGVMNHASHILDLGTLTNAFFGTVCEYRAEKEKKAELSAKRGNDDCLK